MTEYCLSPRTARPNLAVSTLLVPGSTCPLHTIWLFSKLLRTKSLTSTHDEPEAPPVLANVTVVVICPTAGSDVHWKTTLAIGTELRHPNNNTEATRQRERPSTQITVKKIHKTAN